MKFDSITAGLQDLGLKKGSRVGVYLVNCAEWTVLQFATAKAGMILVNINPAYRASHELQHCLNLVECEALVLDSSSTQLDLLNQLCPELESSVPGQLKAQMAPHLRSVIVVDSTKNPSNPRQQTPRGCIHYQDLRMQLLFTNELPSLDPDDPINIQFTSGTTGSPKGATLSHKNIVNNGYFVGQKLQLSSADRVCVPVPLYVDVVYFKNLDSFRH